MCALLWQKDEKKSKHIGIRGTMGKAKTQL